MKGVLIMLVRNSIIQQGLDEQKLEKTRQKYESIVIVINRNKKAKKQTT